MVQNVVTSCEGLGPKTGLYCTLKWFVVPLGLSVV